MDVGGTAGGRKSRLRRLPVHAFTAVCGRRDGAAGDRRPRASAPASLRPSPWSSPCKQRPRAGAPRLQQTGIWRCSGRYCSTSRSPARIPGSVPCWGWRSRRRRCRRRPRPSRAAILAEVVLLDEQAAPPYGVGVTPRPQPGLFWPSRRSVLFSGYCVDGPALNRVDPQRLQVECVGASRAERSHALSRHHTGLQTPPDAGHRQAHAAGAARLKPRAAGTT
ncbi:MAG: hypothetical protein MZU91_08570 [Desulfosudis oleivorans]|nr:hypothetical protein [Desulfosudis oleivorans]